MTIDLPFKIEEQFTDKEGYNGMKFLKCRDRLKTLNFEMMGVRTNFLSAKEKQKDWEEVDNNKYNYTFSASSNSNKRARNDMHEEFLDLWEQQSTFSSSMNISNEKREDKLFTKAKIFFFN